METAEGVRLKPTAEVKGKKAAQIMFVVGTDFLGLEPPLWRENLKLAVKTQDILNSNEFIIKDNYLMFKYDKRLFDCGVWQQRKYA